MVDPITAVTFAGKAADSVSQVAISKIQADSNVKMAKVAAQAARYQTSVNEADEILSVLDRPCIRINIPDPDFAVSMDLSILSMLGGLAIMDLYKGYRLNWETGYINVEGAISNTDVISGLAGTIPIDPRALAVLSGVFSNTVTNGTEQPAPVPPDAPQGEFGSNVLGVLWKQFWRQLGVHY